MSEKEAKKIFLKQAKPFFKRYEQEAARPETRRCFRARKAIDFKASVHAWPGAIGTPFFAGSWHDVKFGPMSMRVPILFPLPLGFEKGFKFTDAATLANFKKYCEEN